MEHLLENALKDGKYASGTYIVDDANLEHMTSGQLATGNLWRRFPMGFSYRFYPVFDGELFYALAGTHCAYYVEITVDNAETLIKSLKEFYPRFASYEIQRKRVGWKTFAVCQIEKTPKFKYAYRSILQILDTVRPCCFLKIKARRRRMSSSSFIGLVLSRSALKRSAFSRSVPAASCVRSRGVLGASYFLMKPWPSGFLIFKTIRL